MKHYKDFNPGKDILIENIIESQHQKLNEEDGGDPIFNSMFGGGENTGSTGGSTQTTGGAQTINVNTGEEWGGFFSNMASSFFEYKLYEKLFAGKDKHSEIINQMSDDVTKIVKSNPNHPWKKGINADISKFKSLGMNFKTARHSVRDLALRSKLNYGFFGRIMLRSRILSPLLRFTPFLFSNPWVAGGIGAGLLGLEIYYYLSRDEDKLTMTGISENGKFSTNKTSGKLINESLAKAFKNATIIGTMAVDEALNGNKYAIGLRLGDGDIPSKDDVLKLADLVKKISYRIDEKTNTDELTKYYNAKDDIDKWEQNIKSFYDGKNLSGLADVKNSNLYTHYIDENDFDGGNNIYGVEMAEKDDWYENFFGVMDAGMNILGWTDWLASSNYLRNIKKINPVQKGDWMYKILLADYYLDLTKLDITGRITEKTFLNLTNIAINSGITDSEYYKMLKVYKREDVTKDSIPDYIETKDYNYGDFQTFLDTVSSIIQTKFVESIKNKSGDIYPVTKPLLALAGLVAVREILLNIYGMGQMALESAYIVSKVYENIQKGVSYEDAKKGVDSTKSPLAQKLDNGDLVDIMGMSSELLGSDLSSIPG